MKLKLVESAQPISKLEYNIQNNILPKFAEQGIVFTDIPTKLNEYIYVYDGADTFYKSPAKLKLNSANPKIDYRNGEPDAPYVYDLYGTLTINGEEIDLGVLSSRDSDSVDDIFLDLKLNDESKYYIDDEPETEIKEKLVPAHDGSEEHTVKEWIEIGNKLKANTGEYKRWFNDKLPLEEDLIAAIDSNLGYDERKKLEKEIDNLYFFS